MSAGAALQAAVAAGVSALGLFDGVYDGPPARAAYPYVALDAGSESDWGHKSGAGREVGLAVTIWAAHGDGLQELADAVEGCVLGTGAVAGWQLVSVRLMRRRGVRDVAGRAGLTIERARGKAVL